VCEVVAVIERRVIVVVDVLRMYVLLFFGHDLREHLSAKANVAKLLALAVDCLFPLSIIVELKTPASCHGLRP
jgi:hypothetical protein